MRDVRARLAAWTDAGLLTPEQAEAIRRHEAGQADRGDAARRGVAAEAVGYVGGALAVGASALLLGEVWPQLALLGRLTLVGTCALLLLGAGLALREAPHGPVARLASGLLAAAVLCAGWFGWLVGDGVLDLDEAGAGLIVGGTAVALALPLYLRRPRALAQVVLLGALVVLGAAALLLPALPPSATWFGLSGAALGVVWLLLGATGWLPPGRVAEILGAVLLVLALHAGSFDDRVLMLSVGVLAALGLVALGTVADRLHHLVIGSAACFVFVPQLVFELFGDAIGAPATLLLVGLLLVLAAVGLGRARGRGGRQGPAADASGRGPGRRVHDREREGVS